MKVLSSLIFLIILFFNACTSFNYNYVPQPLFLKEQALQKNQSIESANLIISRIENNNRTVKLHVHLIDSAGIYYNNMANNNTIWCGLTDNYGGTLHHITDFKVYENRETENVPTVYALVLDHSGSMSGRVNDMQDAVEMFIKNKRPEDAVSIVKYDKVAKTVVPSSADLSFLTNTFQKNGLSGFGGLTAIHNGIYEGIQSIINTPYRRKVVISFTDGGDNSSTITGDYVKWLAQSNNIIVSTIDLGRSVNKGFMQDIAMTTGGTYNYMMYACEFPDVFTDIQNRLSKSYIIEYNSPGSGVHDVQLQACLTNAQLSAKAQYNNTPIAKTAPVREATLSDNLPTTDGKPFNPPKAPRTSLSSISSSSTSRSVAVKNNTKQTVNNSEKSEATKLGGLKKTTSGTNTGSAHQIENNNSNQISTQNSSEKGIIKKPNQTNVQNASGSSNVKSPSKGGLKNSTKQSASNQTNLPVKSSPGKSFKATAQRYSASSKPTKNGSFLLELNYKPGSAEIMLESRTQQLLDQLATTIKNKNSSVRIESYTDNSFDAQMSLNISKDRANVIKQQLVQRGVLANKIQTLGKGSAEPIADNSTAEGRNKNNRHIVVFN